VRRTSTPASSLVQHEIQYCPSVLPMTSLLELPQLKYFRGTYCCEVAAVLGRDLRAGPLDRLLGSGDFLFEHVCASTQAPNAKKLLSDFIVVLSRVVVCREQCSVRTKSLRVFIVEDSVRCNARVGDRNR
jgi:hypothetical protein